MSLDVPSQPRSLVSDSAAYFVPMAVFMAFTWAGGNWTGFYPLSYVLKTAMVAILLVAFWGHYTPIRWTYWWLGVIVGMIGVVQWVGGEKLLLHVWPGYPRPTGTVFDPTGAFTSSWMLYGFIAVRWAGAALLVPVMEELFWRDFLWRQVAAPNDFKLAAVGEWDWKAVAMVTLLFSGVHGQWVMAIVWGLMIAGLLIYTRSLGACIVAHAVTNFLLGAYVLAYRDWGFW